MTRLVCCAGCGEWVARRNAAVSAGGASLRGEAEPRSTGPTPEGWQCRACHAIDTVIAGDPRRRCEWCRAYGDRCRVHGRTP